MRKLELSQMEVLIGGNPFWGSSRTCELDGSYMDMNGDFHPTYMVCNHKYRFWIDFGDCYVAYSCP
jgi:hypothetical protein